MLARCLLILGFLPAWSTAAFCETRPNVLLICIDDLKPNLGCYGDPIAITPGIDALAARGLRFDAAYCNQAVCAPSRNALMTGLRPQTLGIYDLGTNFRASRPDAVTMGQAFQAAGYHAAGLGKIYHHGHGNGDDAATWSVPHFRPKAALYANPETMRSRVRDRRGILRGPSTERTERGDEAYGDGLIAAEAVRRLDQFAESPEQPFFLAVGFARPHLPFNAPARYWDQYDPASMPMPSVTGAPENAPEYAATNSGELYSYRDFRYDKPITDAQTRRLIHGYYAATSYVDAQVGKIIDRLDANGLTDRTIVLLWGDHGWHLGDHGMWCKHTNYEQAARIPLIIMSPTTTAGQSTRAMVETVDIYPTLGAMAQVDVPSDLDGRSFADVLDRPDGPGRPHITHVYPRGGRMGIAVRDSRYRLVRWQSFDGAIDAHELYDYQTDPTETTNIADQNADRVAAMSQWIDAEPAPRRQIRTSGGKSKAKASKSARKVPTRPKYDRAKGFRGRDQNQDGFLSPQEFLSQQPDPDKAPSRFPIFDRNGDGQLSFEEYVYRGKQKTGDGSTQNSTQ